MKRRIVVVSILWACCAGQAMAEVFPTVSLYATPVNPGVAMYIHSSGHKGGAYVGLYNLQLSGATYAPQYLTGSVQSFCIDIWDVSYTNANAPVSYDIKPLAATPDEYAGPMGADRAGYLTTLLDRYWDRNRWSTDVSRTFIGLSSTPYTADKVAAALQVAVWEIVDEGNDGIGTGDPLPDNWGDVTTGGFYVNDASVAGIANFMLTAVRSEVEQSGMFGVGSYLGLSNHSNWPEPLGRYQDYVVAVPVPPAILVGVFGLGVTVWRLRKVS